VLSYQVINPYQKAGAVHNNSNDLEQQILIFLVLLRLLPLLLVLAVLLSPVLLLVQSVFFNVMEWCCLTISLLFVYLSC
jgi:hypothetical protein